MKEDFKIYTSEEQEEAMDHSCGTSLAGYLKDTTYTQLVSALGKPTHPDASGDNKIQKEWIIEFKGTIFTIYDWKTYSEEDTIMFYRNWHIGSKNTNPFRSVNYKGKPSVRVEEFIEHIKFLVHLEDTKSELGLGNLEN
jgi:hypothetical protein